MTEVIAADPDSPMLPEHRFLPDVMRAYCAWRGATFLRVLQLPLGPPMARPGVLLAIDGDGVVKVFKEELPNGDPMATAGETESTLHAAASGIVGVSRFCGIDLFEGVRVMRQEFTYGTPLEPWLLAAATGNGLEEKALRAVVGGVARVLRDLHAQGIVHRDILARHVRIEDGVVSLIDLGDGCRVRVPRTTDSEYLAPVTETDILRLGQLGRKLAKRPIAPWLEDILARMTVVPRGRRPDAAAVVEECGCDKVSLPPLPDPFRRTVPASGTVLFPARMGIPHKGHIDFMSRVMDLGYPLIVSLQGAYTLSPIDPLPKWQVMKMVAASLRARGYVPGLDFRFVFTPLFENDAQHRMHFAMMPGFADVWAVATGNPEVQELFAHLRIIDQKAVFGHEGQPYRMRSWGSALRRTVRDGDERAFRLLAAAGVTEVLDFAALRRACAAVTSVTPLRPATVSVFDGTGTVLASGRVLRYLSPEEAAVRLLTSAGRSARVVDLYARDTVIALDGEERRLEYLATADTSGGPLDIRFAVR